MISRSSPESNVLQLLTNSDTDNVWAQLASLEVFNPASWIHAPNCIDVVADVNGIVKNHQLTFGNAKQLKDYLKKAPTVSRTRFV